MSNDIKTISVHIDSLELNWFIGIFDEEYENAQKVRFDIALDVIAPLFDGNEDYDDVVCYKTIVDNIKVLRDTGHIRLVETLADKVCDICLHDKRVLKASVKVIKPDAIDECVGVGVTLVKYQK